MTTDDFKKLARKIVSEALELNVLYASEKVVPVNHACVFAQNIEEYEDLFNVASKIRSVMKKTKT